MRSASLRETFATRRSTPCCFCVATSKGRHRYTIDSHSAMAPDHVPSSGPTQSKTFPWYDSNWLAQYTEARAIIRKVKPQALSSFTAAFHVLHTREDFEVQLIDQVFDDDLLKEVRREMAGMRPACLELHEARTFGRFVVHDHPFVTELQSRTVPLVSHAVGEPVEASYNFLSRYTSRGVCAPHMDSSDAKWTLDLCLDQSAPWPISLSQVVPWPEPRSEWFVPDWEQRVKSDPQLRFSSYALQPGQALVFSGSSQWHYREPIDGAAHQAFCDLLFFHFVPRGTAELVRPENWAGLFDIPELAVGSLLAPDTA